MQQVSTRLTVEAERLATVDDGPTDLTRVLSSAQVGLRLVTTESSEKHGRIRQAPNGWEITVFRNKQVRSTPGSLSGRERFTTAHEFGHYLVETLFGFRSRSRGEYWRLEKLCNEFAGQLLIPSSALSFDADQTRSACDVATLVADIAHRTQVTMEPVARRIIPSLGQPCSFAYLEPWTYPTTGRTGRISWVTESRRWLGSGQRRAVYEGSFLTSLFNERSHRHLDSIPGAVDSCIKPSVWGSRYICAILPAQQSFGDDIKLFGKPIPHS